MKQILQNIAHIMLLRHCLDNGIDCSGTYCVKNGRGYTYSLRDNQTGQKEIARISFHKNKMWTLGSLRQEQK